MTIEGINKKSDLSEAVAVGVFKGGLALTLLSFTFWLVVGSILTS